MVVGNRLVKPMQTRWNPLNLGLFFFLFFAAEASWKRWRRVQSIIWIITQAEGKHAEGAANGAASRLAKPGKN